MKITNSSLNAIAYINAKELEPNIPVDDLLIRYLIDMQLECIRHNDAWTINMMIGKLVHTLTGQHTYEIDLQKL